MPFNLLVTAHRFESAQAQRQLRELAGVELKRTSFRDVLVGQVEDQEKLFESLGRALGGPRAPGAPAFLPAFARLVPLEESFTFEPSGLPELLKQKITPYADRIQADRSFAIRLERRGFKGTLRSNELEKQLAEHLYRLLEAQGKSPKVDLEDPDVLLTIQLVGTECGLGLIERELRRRFPFVRAD